jgi:hypothetical protein
MTVMWIAVTVCLAPLVVLLVFWCTAIVCRLIEHEPLPTVNEALRESPRVAKLLGRMVLLLIGKLISSVSGVLEKGFHIVGAIVQGLIEMIEMVAGAVVYIAGAIVALAGALVAIWGLVSLIKYFWIHSWS